jgi:predicted transcriptional regulator
VANPSGTDRVLGDVLRAQRERQDRSQESLAHDAGLTTIAVGNIERGDSDPHWSTVRRIVTALGLSMQELGKRLDKSR